MVLRGYSYKDEFKMISRYGRLKDEDISVINWQQGNKVCLKCFTL